MQVEDDARQGQRWRPAVFGAGIACASGLLSAVVFALCFRYPVPLAGMIGPFGEPASREIGPLGSIALASVAWAVYGVVFGFFAVEIGGGAGIGVWCSRQAWTQPRRHQVTAALAAALGVSLNVVLSTFDLVFGAW